LGVDDLGNWTKLRHRHLESVAKRFTAETQRARRKPIPVI
jgi:hypothetical protein